MLVLLVLLVQWATARRAGEVKRREEAARGGRREEWKDG